MKKLLIVFAMLTLIGSCADAAPTIVQHGCEIKAVPAADQKLDGWWFCIQESGEIGAWYAPNIDIFNECDHVLKMTGQFQDISEFVADCDSVVGIEKKTWGTIKAHYR